MMNTCGLTGPNYVLIQLLNEYIDSASFASFGSWFQSIAPLYLKTSFRYRHVLHKVPVASQEEGGGGPGERSGQKLPLA